jgi:hypothetical protein
MNFVANDRSPRDNPTMKGEAIATASIAAFLFASCEPTRRSPLDALQLGMSIEQVRDQVSMHLRQEVYDEDGDQHHIFLLMDDQRHPPSKAGSYTYICFLNGKYKSLSTSPEGL